MGLRDRWEFSYPCGEVARAADVQVKRRERRVEFWTKERQNIMDEIKESGLEVEIYGQGMTKMSIENHAEVRIDAKLQERLSKADAYLRKARTEKKQYEMFAQVLGSQKPESTVELHPDDVYFFSLHKDPDPDFLNSEEQQDVVGESVT